MEMKKNDRFVLKIEDMGENGEGIGRLDGYIWFVKDAVIGDKVLAFGEIGLAGEIRAVSHCEQRVQEAGRLGFQRCVIPFHNYKSLSKDLKKELDIVPVRTVRDAFSALTVKD